MRCHHRSGTTVQLGCPSFVGSPLDFPLNTGFVCVNVCFALVKAPGDIKKKACCKNDVLNQGLWGGDI